VDTPLQPILRRIGKTPLLRLDRLARHLPDVEIYAKAEWANPGGSVKDRAALAMVLDGERRGLLGEGKILLDATSGNTGIAYAMIGAVRGFPVRLTLPSNASPERKRVLRAFGVDVVLTDPLRGSDGAIIAAREMAAEEPGRYFYPDQYANPQNPGAHERTTGPEIFEETRGRLTHFVAGLGTTGTFVGTTRFLRGRDPRIRAVSVQPDSPINGLEGLKHMESSIRPEIYDATLADENLEMPTEEAYEMVKRLAREEGLLAGVSSGAVAAATLRIAERERRGVFVTVFPDDGAKYLSERFWDEL
jgi:cysteine synthase B